MITPSLVLRHLCFTGPNKLPALLSFEPGLNILYGASDTGKSFVLESIDFMLGGRGPLRDIPERVGYDRILLGINTSENQAFTLVRATSGGQFQLYEGLHETVPVDVEAIVLAARHNHDNDRNVSGFLLDKIGLKGNRIRKNAQSQTQSLSFRNLCHLCLVNEEDIQKQGSPIESGRPTDKTAEYSTFKLLLTGVDDSALVSAVQCGAQSQARTSQLELIDEILSSYQDRLANASERPEELANRLGRLEITIASEQQALGTSEDEYQAYIDRRNGLRRKLENASERRGEVSELIARFRLLDEHYQSDLERLDGIREAGCLVAALSPRPCPLCGALPDQQHAVSECDGNITQVVVAADAESAKILRLRRELEETVMQLHLEAQSFDRLIPRIREDLRDLDENIQRLGPGLVERRSMYAGLVENRSVLRSYLSTWDQIASLQTRRATLETRPDGEGEQPPGTVDLSTSTMDQFAREVERLFVAWNLPEAERVHFDQSDRDLIIGGKRRSSRGKGLRAITHAAFTIGLLEFCRTQNRPHPGFVVLDSPLLAYREPEGVEDDLKGTDVQDKFYEYLSKWTDRQIIIIENTDPPQAVQRRPTSTFFSKNPHQGRYGFFPPSTNTNEG